MKLDIKKYVKRMPLRYYLGYLAIILGGVLADQATKLAAVKYLAPVVDVPIWEGVLHLHFHLNDGAAFGSFSGQPYIFNTVSVLIIIGMSLYLFLGHTGSRTASVAAAMIISGGVGNMIDRASFGEVTDFIYFKLIDFAIFNVADCFVCVGAGILILALVLELRDEIKADKAKKAAAATEKNGENTSGLQTNDYILSQNDDNSGEADAPLCECEAKDTPHPVCEKPDPDTEDGV